MSLCVDLMGCISSKVESDYEESEEDDEDLFEGQDEEESEIKSGSDMIASSQEGLEGYRVHWDDEVSGEYTLPGFSSRPTTAGRRFSTRSGMSSEYVLEEEEMESEVSYNTDSRAPSISLWYNDSVKGDILTQDIYVPASGVTKQTYYCCLQWNSGRNGGGYCGIQDHARGRNYIFSLWDPEGVHQPIKPVFEGPGTICEPFGGEGTGLKSWNFELRWEPDHWYTFVLRRWDEAGHTYYGLWIKHQMMCRWTHFVTLDFPLPDIYFDSWTCSFLEDWQGTGNNERRVHFKNGYKRSKDRKWVAFDKGAFNVVREESSQKYEENFDCGMFEDTYYLQSGGVTIHNDDLCEGTEFGCKMAPQPDAPPIRCYLTAVKNMFILWDVPIGNVPQFKYTVKVDGNEVKSEVNSETRACQLENKPEETVELIVEDIYGRTAQIKFDVKGDKEICDDNCATSESSM